MSTTAEKLAYLIETKSGIRDSIVQKGVAVPEDTPFRQYRDKVGEISAGAYPLTYEWDGDSLTLTVTEVI